MVGLGLFFGTILAIAYRFLKVDEDPRIETTKQMLPGTNCGACGEPGCRAFAEKLVSGERNPERVHGQPADAIERDRRVPRRRCRRARRNGSHGCTAPAAGAQANQIAEYEGFEGCRAAALDRRRRQGLHLGLPRPRRLRARLHLRRDPHERQRTAAGRHRTSAPPAATASAPARATCSNWCRCSQHLLRAVQRAARRRRGDGALHRRLRRLRPVRCRTRPGLIRMDDNLPVVDYSSGGEPRPDAVFRCPTRAIVWLEREQFQDQESRKVGAA